MSDLDAVLARLEKITPGTYDSNYRLALDLVPELIAVAKAAAEVAEVYDGRNLRFRNLKHALSALAKRGME